MIDIHSSSTRRSAHCRSVAVAGLLLLASLLRSPPALSQAGSATLHSFKTEAQAETYLDHVYDLGSMAYARADSDLAASCGSLVSALARRYVHDDGSIASNHGLVVHVTLESTNGGPLANASALLEGTEHRALTNENGEATIVVPSPLTFGTHAGLLRLRLIGYRSRVVRLEGSSGDTVDVRASLCPMAIRLQAPIITPAVMHAVGSLLRESDRATTVMARNHIVVLRRGHLFSIDVGAADRAGSTPRVVDAMDVFEPGLEPSDRRYESLLANADRLIVTGEVGLDQQIELALFRIDSAGRLRRDGTYQFRQTCAIPECQISLEGDKLILYAPVELNPRRIALRSTGPAMRTWMSDGSFGEYQSLVSPERTFRYPDDSIAPTPLLHTVTTCDLARSGLGCRTAIIVAPYPHSVHLSATGAYLGTEGATGEHRKGAGSTTRATLFHVPLNDSNPTAIRIAGAPIGDDAISEGSNGELRLFIRVTKRLKPAADAEGSTPSDVALLRLSPKLFADGNTAAPPSGYLWLGSTYPLELEHRFIGDWLVYGVANDEFFQLQIDTTTLRMVRAGDAAQRSMLLRHDIQMIGEMGPDAIVIGRTNRDYRATVVALGARPIVGAGLALPHAPGLELFLPETPYTGTIGGNTIFGLRIRGNPVNNGSQASSIDQILFLRKDGRNLVGLGSLDSKDRSSDEDVVDGCRSSCYDWFRGSRPLFLGDRIFALLGYELIEGRVNGDRIEETSRLDFTPMGKSPATSH